MTVDELFKEKSNEIEGRLREATWLHQKREDREVEVRNEKLRRLGLKPVHMFKRKGDPEEEKAVFKLIEPFRQF